MKSVKTKQKKEVDTFSFFFILIILFLIPFFVSYLFTRNYIERKSAVTLEEEASQFERVLGNSDLTNLYENSSTSLFKKDKVLVLGYHQVREPNSGDSLKAQLFITSPTTFEKEMKILREKGYESITLTEYINYLTDKIHNSIPEKSVVITFDDGYKTQYTNAFPILKKYGFGATLFLYMSCIDKYPTCMTSEEIKEMTNSNIKVANHTLNHVLLTDYKESIIKKEISENQTLLKNTFGKENVEKVLAYPYGAQSEKIKRLLRDMGYIGGLGVKVENKEEDVMNLDRYLIGNKTDVFDRLP